MDIVSRIEIDSLQKAPLSNEEILELLALICSTESAAPFYEHIRVLHDKYDTTVDVRPLEIEVLSMRDKFSPHALRQLYHALADRVGYLDTIVDIVRYYPHDPDAALYIKNIGRIFAKEPDETLARWVLDYIDKTNVEGVGISAIADYYQGALERVSEYAPIPSYIRDFVLDEVVPTQVLVDKLARRQDIDETTKSLTEKIEDMSLQDRVTLAALLNPDEIARFQCDKTLFRIYGPVNPSPDPAENISLGGPRMFLDTDLEAEPETGAPLDDWYVGYCMECSKRIRKYHHAVRIPHLGGGWKGCYCSWDCVRKGLKDPEQLLLIDHFEQSMHDIGIQDRDD